MLLTPLLPAFDSAPSATEDRGELQTSACLCAGGPERSVVLAGSCGTALKEELPSIGPKFYYDKAKSFFDNISSDMKFR